MNQPYLNMVPGCGRRPSSIPIQAVRPGSWGRLPRPNVTILFVAQPTCIHSTWHITHSTLDTYLPTRLSLAYQPDWPSPAPVVYRTWTAGLAGWLNGWLGWLCTPLSRSVRLSRSGPSCQQVRRQLKVKRGRHGNKYSICLDGLESARSTVNPCTHSGLLSDVSLIRRDDTIESHALPPSQPQPPAHRRRTGSNERTPALNNHLPASRPALANETSAVKVPRCD